MADAERPDALCPVVRRKDDCNGLIHLRLEPAVGVDVDGAHETGLARVGVDPPEDDEVFVKADHEQLLCGCGCMCARERERERER